MVINKNYIVSSNRAKPVTESKNRGFMYFRDYVLYSDVVINKWHITFSDGDIKIFSVYYINDTDNENDEEIIYQAMEIDKSYTYKMLIYIIRKCCDSFDENLADNFEEESYELKVNEK